MARDEEKAQASLNRYWAHRKALDDGDYQVPDRRPHLATAVTDLKEAEKWRKQLQRELSGKIAKIQIASLPEEEIRQLNDDINKLLRTRIHWETQIKKLGGRDYEEIR